MRTRLLRDSTWIFGIVCAIYALLYIWAIGYGSDSHAYWLAWRGPLYTTAPGTTDAYLYSPAFAQAIWPLTQLPWPAFAATFSVGLGLALAWLLKPMGWRWGLPLWLAGLPDVLTGNIFILMAIAAVAGFARPESWAFVALTKITPCVGPIWFLVRGEWKNLIRAVVSIGAIAALSAVFAPSLWQQWLAFLVSHASASTGPIGSPFLPPSAVRIPIGIALVVWGARKNKRWCIPVAMLLCTPVLWLGSFTLLAAIPRMKAAQRIRQQPERVPPSMTGSN